MPLNQASRVFLLAESALLAALTIYSASLITRMLPNIIRMFRSDPSPLAAILPLYFLLMLISSVSLFCLVVDYLLAGAARISPVLRRMSWIALVGAIGALIGFGIDTVYEKPDEGNLSRATVWLVFAPYLFMWVPLVHLRLARAWAGHLTIGSSDRGSRLR
jgi:hypothetical protein